MRESNASGSPELHIHIAGDFDSLAALATRETCAGALHAGGSVVLDFGRARRVDPAGLVCLAGALPRGCAGQLVVRGLTREQLRILRYMGVDPPAFGAGSGPRAPAEGDG